MKRTVQDLAPAVLAENIVCMSMHDQEILLLSWAIPFSLRCSGAPPNMPYQPSSDFIMSKSSLATFVLASSLSLMACRPLSTTKDADVVTHQKSNVKFPKAVGIAALGGILGITTENGDVYVARITKLGDAFIPKYGTKFNRVDMTNIRSISGNAMYDFAKRSDGSIFAFGWAIDVGNDPLSVLYYMRIKLRRDGFYEESSFQVPSLVNVDSISAGGTQVLALNNDGTIKSFGINDVGQLGDEGSPLETNSPTTGIPNVQDVIAVAAGHRHSLALKKDGTVWVWGDDSNGTYWDAMGGVTFYGGTKAQRFYQNVPHAVAGLSNITAISTEFTHSLALRKDGVVFAWGDNRCGQLGKPPDSKGDVDTNFDPVPTEVTVLDDVVAIAAGKAHSLALKRDGTVWGWGNAGNGQLGRPHHSSNDSFFHQFSCSEVRGPDDLLPSFGNFPLPQRIFALHDIIAIAASDTASFALQKNGDVWAFGTNCNACITGAAPRVVFSKNFSIDNIMEYLH